MVGERPSTLLDFEGNALQTLLLDMTILSKGGKKLSTKEKVLLDQLALGKV